MPIRKYEQLLKPLTINSMEVSNRVITVSETAYDTRKYQNLSWRQAVRSALRNLGGKSELSRLYAELESFFITKKHSNPQAKVRETLQKNPEFQPASRGVWSIQEAD
jgi:hypothetical protein